MQLQEQYVCPEMRYMAVMLKLSWSFFDDFTIDGLTGNPKSSFKDFKRF